MEFSLYCNDNIIYSWDLKYELQKKSRGIYSGIYKLDKNHNNKMRQLVEKKNIAEPVLYYGRKYIS